MVTKFFLIPPSVTKFYYMAHIVTVPKNFKSLINLELPNI
jgi:hypothetical protein